MHHTDELLGYIHGPVQWAYANAAARTGATGFVAADVTQRKCCVQTDNNTMWMLTAVTPTWALVSARGLSGNVTVTDAGVASVAGFTVTSQAAGDLFVGASASTVARLAKGTAYQVLRMKSDASTAEWGLPTDLAIASQAAGDVLYFDGTNWVRLAKDAGKYLKSGASAVSWDTPAAGGGIVGVSFFMPGVCYTGENIAYVRVPVAFTISIVQIAVSSAPTGSALTVDVNYHASDSTALTTIFTTGPGTNRPSIAATGTTDDSGAPDVTSIDAGGFLSFSVDAVGSTLPGTNLMVTIVAA